MNMKNGVFLVVLVALGCPSGAWARSGEVTVVQCSGSDITTVATTPQTSFGIGRGYGTVRTEPAGGLLDMMSSQCTGAFRVVDGKPSLWGHCEWTDKDGDKVLLNYARSDVVAGRYTIVLGTGKFSGIQGTRDYRITPFPALPGARVVCDTGVVKYTLPD